MADMQKILLALFLLAAGCAKESPRQEETPPRQSPQAEQTPPAVPPPAFDGERAFTLLTKQTSFGPRNPGSPGHQKCLDYIRAESEATASNVTLQAFDMDGYDGEKLHLTNVFASYNLAAKTRILLLAHWDTRPRADQDPDPKKRSQPIAGANDGASGVAVLLELGRLFKQTPPPVGVDLLYVDGEDYGREGDDEHYLLGTRYFAQHLPIDYHPAYGILLDMVGDANLELMREPNSVFYAKEIVDMVWATAATIGVYQFTNRDQRPVLDDHVPLNRAGIRTIDLIDFEYPDASNRYWHTTADTPDKCSAASLEAVGRVLLEVLYRQPR